MERIPATWVSRTTTMTVTMTVMMTMMTMMIFDSDPAQATYLGRQ